MTNSMSTLQTVAENHSREVRSIRQNLGVVISASKDGICQVWEPSGTPSILHSLNMEAEIAAVRSIGYSSKKSALTIIYLSIDFLKDGFKSVQKLFNSNSLIPILKVGATLMYM